MLAMVEGAHLFLFDRDKKKTITFYLEVFGHLF